jgi:hypothetical protein
VHRAFREVLYVDSHQHALAGRAERPNLSNRFNNPCKHPFYPLFIAKFNRKGGLYKSQQQNPSLAVEGGLEWLMRQAMQDFLFTNRTEW